jgi:hypothetical protein
MASPKYPQLDDPAFLRREYVERRKGPGTIAQALGAPKTTVFDALCQQDIPLHAPGISKAQGFTLTKKGPGLFGVHTHRGAPHSRASASRSRVASAGSRGSRSNAATARRTSSSVAVGRSMQ